MRPQEMDALIERHMQAEMAGDLDGAVSVYTDDVEYDDVGVPDAPSSASRPLTAEAGVAGGTAGAGSAP